MHIVGQLVFGLIVGIVAKFLLPGSDPGGLIVTALLGMAGGFIGGQIGSLFGWYKGAHPAGFGLSVVGAMILLLGYRVLMH